MGITITEYIDLAPVGRNVEGVAQIPMEPPNVVQSTITPTSTSQQSAAFNENTRYVEITTDGATTCRFLFGSNPSAGPDNSYLGAGLSVFRGVQGGQKVAFVTP